MPHAVEVEQPTKSGRGRVPKAKASSSRELRQLRSLYDQSRDHYLESTLSLSINNLLQSKNRPAVTKIISLGLGSLASTDQSRRIKQLTIFLAIAEQLQQQGSKLEIYAQDPSFSKTDEAFLRSFGVHILSTPSATTLGEAAQCIDKSTLVYCPFLTLEAYELLFSTRDLNFFIGDDFDALRIKWPKHSTGRKEAESLSRSFVQGYRKRTVNGSGFWDVDDKPFPMAMYSERDQSKLPKPRL
ncbi:hypothetical protein BP6252_13621 [Coleophoma cylindrospora]|uniref:SRR1-like domain-containing protein n=1 Tax=Coleophoma cylindrospora TaxID=1849047 RepID=A0A3D8Q969_9HELO|nr:hypothetical protein BP6252_13621 [Coleophoma cylindrospora]